MKKQFVSAMVITIVLSGALVNSAPASACPYARNSKTLNIENSPNNSLPLAIKKSHSDMMFGIAATVGLLAMGWVVASRFNHLAPVSTPNDEQNKSKSSLAVISQ